MVVRHQDFLFGFLGEHTLTAGVTKMPQRSLGLMVVKLPQVWAQCPYRLRCLNT